MLGNREKYPLPGRLFRHGTNFDFMFSFEGYEPNNYEKEAFIELMKNEISYSKILEEMLYESRSRYRKKYFVLQKILELVEITNSENKNL